MKFVVFGAGGVGGFYGGMLAKCGYPVVFVARGEHLKVMKERGLRIESCKHGSWTIREDGEKIIFTDNPLSVKDADVVFVCVKSYDTEKVAPFVREMLKEDGVAVSVQNGIENEEILENYVGKGRVLGATAFVGTYVKSPGVIVHEAAGLLEIGEMDGKLSERVERLVSTLKKCGIEARVSKDIRYTLWKKLVWNVAFNPYSVVTRATVGEMLAHRKTYEVLKRLMLECYVVAEKYGVRLKPSVMEKYLKSSPDLMEYKTSMLLDYEKGRPLEIEGITGALIRKAEEVEVEVPYNRCVYATVKFLEEKRKNG